MIEREAKARSNFLLSAFNVYVHKLFDFAALQTHQMVMVFGFTQFIRSTFRVKVVATQKTGHFKLCQNTVNGCQTDIFTFFPQLRKNFIGRQMALFR